MQKLACDQVNRQVLDRKRKIGRLIHTFDCFEVLPHTMGQKSNSFWFTCATTKNL